MAHLSWQMLSADRTRTYSLFEEPPPGYCQWHYCKRECGATDEQMNTGVNLKAKMEKWCVRARTRVCVCVIDDGRLNGELLQLSCGKLVRTDAITLTADTRPSITVTQSSHSWHLQIAVSEGCVCVRQQQQQKTQWAKPYKYDTNSIYILFKWMYEYEICSRVC